MVSIFKIQTYHWHCEVFEVVVLISHPNNFGIYLKKKIQLGRLQKNHIFTLPQGSTLLSYYYIQHNAILYKTNIPNTDCIFVTIAVILQREISPILLVVIGENYNIENL